MKKFLLFIIVSLFFCSVVYADDYTGEWYLESCVFQQDYPGYHFSGTNYSIVLNITDTDTLKISDPFHGTIEHVLFRDGNYTYIEGYTVDIENSHIVFSNENTEMTFSKKLVPVIIPPKKYPSGKDVFLGEWKVTGYGVNGAYIKAEEFGLEGTAIIQDSSLQLVFLKDDKVTELLFELEPDMKFDSLWFIYNGKLCTISLRNDGTLLLFVDFASYMLTLAKTD